MRATYRQLAALVRAEVLPESLLTMTLDVAMFKGTAHSTSCWKSDSYTHRSGPSPRTTITVEEASTLKSDCTCLADWASGTLHEALVLTALFSQARRAMKSRTTGRASGSVEKQRLDLDQGLESLEWVKDPALDDARHQADKELRAASARLAASLRGPAQRAQSLETAARGVRGRATFELDDTQVLVGLLGARHLPKSVVEFINPFVLRNEDVMVMAMPRYGYDFLQRELVRTVGIPRLLVAHEATDTADVLETAATLWSPGDLGPYQDLKAALKAARVV